MTKFSETNNSGNTNPNPKGGWWQFGLACLAYFLIFAFRVDDFPIYFFCDEAYPTLTGLELYNKGLKDNWGTYLPIYFEAAAGRWTPVLTVYFYGLAALLGGNSIVLSRTVGVLLSLLAPVGCAFTLRYVFKARFWWIAIPLFALIPGWITHARTVFEAVTMSSFFALFIFFYLRSRNQSLWYLPLAGLSAACAFYTYSNGQVVVVSTILLTFLTSLSYYFKNWRATLFSILLGAILCIPLFHFRAKHGQKLEEHLKTVDSYLVKNIPIQEKAELFGTKYLAGLTPTYWFIPNDRDLERHRVATYPQVSPILIPFLVLGLLISIRYIRRIEYRLPILALISAPVGGALVEVTILRAIVIMVPIVLISAIGLNFILLRLGKFINGVILSLPVLVGCFLYTATLLHFALTELPKRYRDYGLYGVQYGAKQLFTDRIPYYLNKFPEAKLRLSPVWANGTDLFPRFFLSEKDRLRLILDSIDRYTTKMTEISPNDIFIFTPGDYKRAVDSKKFSALDIIETVPYPSGEPGFHFMKMVYAPGVDQLFLQEQEARKQLVESEVKSQFFEGKVRYSVIDTGEIKNIFDGDRNTLARGFEANPFIMDILFSQPRSISKIGVIANPNRLLFKVRAFAAGEQELGSASNTIMRDDAVPVRELSFTTPLMQVSRIRIELSDLDIAQAANIHIWELVFDDSVTTDPAPLTKAP